MRSSDRPGGPPEAVTPLPATPPAPERTPTAAFHRAWLTVGLIALVIYGGVPTALSSSGGEEHLTTYLWLVALWLVPAAIMVIGFVFGSRQLGRVAVLVGSALLSLNTLVYFLLALQLHMVGCQVTLWAIGLLGVIAPHRSRWGFWRWTLVLLSPTLVGVVAHVLFWGLVWPWDV